MDIKRMWCWWRGYHREAGQAGFQYGLNGYCVDCGKVGDGINQNDDQPFQPFAFGLSRPEVQRLVRRK